MMAQIFHASHSTSPEKPKEAWGKNLGASVYFQKPEVAEGLRDRYCGEQWTFLNRQLLNLTRRIRESRDAIQLEGVKKKQKYYKTSLKNP
jgi:hypothetical protein